MVGNFVALSRDEGAQELNGFRLSHNLLLQCRSLGLIGRPSCALLGFPLKVTLLVSLSSTVFRTLMSASSPFLITTRLHCRQTAFVTLPTHGG